MRHFLMALCVTLAVPGVVFAAESSSTTETTVKSMSVTQPPAAKPKAKAVSKPAMMKRTRVKKSPGGKAGVSY